jgi:cytochrome c556
MRRIVVAAAAVMALVGVARASGPVNVNPDDVIAGRQAAFDLMQGNVAAMKAAIDGSQPVKPLAAGAKGIVAWAKVIPSMFPAGTDSGHDTKAKAEIWSDAAGFAKAAVTLQQAAEKLATLAAADDKAGFAEQFDAMGKACGGCHRTYRVRSN